MHPLTCPQENSWQSNQLMAGEESTPSMCIQDPHANLHASPICWKPPTYHMTQVSQRASWLPMLKIALPCRGLSHLT